MTAQHLLGTRDLLHVLRGDLPSAAPGERLDPTFDSEVAVGESMRSIDIIFQIDTG